MSGPTQFAKIGRRFLCGKEVHPLRWRPPLTPSFHFQNGIRKLRHETDGTFSEVSQNLSSPDLSAFIKQQVPPLRRRWRSGSGRDDRLFVVARTRWRCTPTAPSSSPVTGGWPTLRRQDLGCPMLRDVRSMGTTDDGIRGLFLSSPFDFAKGRL